MDSLIKSNDKYLRVIRHYDEKTGERLGDTHIEIDVEELKTRKVDLTRQIKEIDDLIKECESL